MKLKEDVLGMINPSIDSMLKQTHSKYALVVLASKRARELLNGAPCRIENRASKYVTDAMAEINEGKITYALKE